MKSWKTYFSISPAIIKEDIRRLWAIPTIYFVLLLISTVLPVLFNYDNLDNMAYTIRNMLDMGNPLVIFVLLTLPVTMGCCTFLYMQRTASCTSMHSLPMSRSRLFNSSFVAAFLMSAMPVVLNDLILMAISKPVYPYYDDPVRASVNVFSKGAIGHFMAESLVIIAFMLAFSVFATIVTGNIVMSALASYGFAFLLPGLCLIHIALANLYLKGFQIGDVVYNSIYKLNPLIQSLAHSITTVQMVIYIIAAVLVLALSEYLYIKRKLERAGESFVYAFLVPIISYLIGFVGLIILGNLFRSFYGSNDKLIVGYIIGGAFFFIIGRMICLKTFRIINKATLKNMAIFAVISCIVLAVYAMDITGYEKRIPAIENVECATSRMINSIVGYTDNRFNNKEEIFNYNTEELEFVSGLSGYYNADVFKDKENIEHMMAVHQLLIEKAIDPYYDYEEVNGRSPYMPIDDYYVYGNATRWFRLAYMGDDGKMFTREYQAYLADFVNNQDIKAIYESDEFKGKYLLTRAKDAVFNYAVITNNLTLESAYIKTDLEGLIKAMDKDFMERSYEEQIDIYENNAVEINLSFDRVQTQDAYVKNEKSVPRATVERLYTSEICLKVFESDENTRKWLVEHGYGDMLEKNLDNVVGISAYKNYDVWNTTGEYHGEFYIHQGQITREQIEYIIDHGRAYNFNSGDYVEINIITNNDMSAQEVEKSRQERQEWIEKYGGVPGIEYDVEYLTDEVIVKASLYGNAYICYLLRDEVPDFLEKL